LSLIVSDLPAVAGSSSANAFLALIYPQERPVLNEHTVRAKNFEHAWRPSTGPRLASERHDRRQVDQASWRSFFIDTPFLSYLPLSRAYKTLRAPYWAESIPKKENRYNQLIGRYSNAYCPWLSSSASALHVFQKPA
jgi:hypothetical protein